jgi:hypothetical protein
LKFEKRARKQLNQVICTSLINKWLQYFNDGHLQITSNQNNDYFDSVAYQKRYDSTEIINISEEDLSRLAKSQDIEGVYYYKDSTYKIALLKNKTLSRDYVGIVLQSKNKRWITNQVKFELKEVSLNNFNSKFYFSDHHWEILKFVYSDNNFNNRDWVKEGFLVDEKQKNIYKKEKEGNQYFPVSAKQINNKTIFIKIQTFEDWNARAIDSIFKINEAVLKSSPYLILDLRGNGGGSDFAYNPIIPYIYTNPIITTGVDVFSSPANIASWEILLKDPYLPMEEKKDIEKSIEQMKMNVNAFVNISPDDTLKMNAIEACPRKIVILIDNNCASTTEQFLLAAKQSTKVTIMGMSTGGVLDYSNVREQHFSCLPNILCYATTRSRRIDKGKGIDNEGIKPDILLKPNEDWTKMALNYFNISP